MSADEAAAKGFYFLIKMYDYHPDGTYHSMQDWYYVKAALILQKGSKYFFDSIEDHSLHVYTGTCEYVEIAITTREPENYNKWPTYTDWQPHWQEPYFTGTAEDLIAESGMLYNSNASYEAPPYVKTQTPIPNAQGTAGYEYRFDVVYDDDLYHPTSDQPASIDAFVDNSTQAAQQTVRVSYITLQQDLHTGADMIATIAGDLPFDRDRDGYVDMDGDYTQFKWKYKYDGNYDQCPNKDKHVGGVCSVEKGCAIIGVEFNFKASNMWQDDITEYDFTIEGVVGSRSKKIPNVFGACFAVPGLCPCCYRSQGIDWNLWGKPTMLDAPENLDLEAMAREGGTDEKVLAELSSQMNKNNMNGRLMLVVEDKSKGAGNREEYEKITGELEEEVGIKEKDVIASSVFEINFNRVCPAVKLKPDKGESLRVQVGYPHGITYEDLGDKVIKAYHFTRCSPDNPKCSTWGQEGHVVGDHIVGVDEIQVIPNPLGMVILCNSFSPFELVVLDKNSEAAQKSKFQETTPILTVVSDSNGVLKVDGHEAVGSDGDVKFPENTEKTFTVEPKAGYQLDTVSLGGKQISVVGNQFTVDSSMVQENSILSATFLPDEIKKESGETVVAGVCEHLKTHKNGTDTPATCTTNGHVAEEVCDDCGQIVTPESDIPATGHTPYTVTKAVPATCSTGGTQAVTKCSTCGADITKATPTAALGHQFFSYEKVADATCQHGVVRQAKCERCGEAVNQITEGEKQEHSYTKVISETPATCTANKVQTLQCTWCNATITKEVPNTTVPHTPSTDHSGTCSVCHKYICEKQHTFETLPGKAPTCTENGKEARRGCTVCGYTEPEKIILATGHNFDGNHAGAKCQNPGCTAEMKFDNHTIEAIPDIQATCETEGTQGGTRCSECGQIITSPSIVSALGHSWNKESAEWHWSTEGEPSASATLTCSVCKNTETFAATLSDETNINEATCMNAGSATFTATVTATGTGGTVTVTDTQSASLPVVSHTWDAKIPPTTTDSTCTHHATRTYTCKWCEQVINEIVETEPLKDHTMVPDPHNSRTATCLEPGLSVSYCTVCDTEATVELPASGHTFVDGVCMSCGALDPTYVATTICHVTFMDNNTELLVIKDVEAGKTMESLPTPTQRSGYTFSGWKTQDGRAFTTSTVVTTDLTVYPMFTSMSSGSDSYNPAPSTPQITMRDTEEEVDVTIPVNVTSVTLPKEVPLNKTVDVTVKGSKPVKVDIPVEKPGPGIVAVIVREDGTEEIVRDCIMTEDGVALTLDGSTVLKVINNATEFEDEVAWASDAMQFVSAREIFKGTGDHIFSPELEMSRGMLVTALYRLAYEPQPGKEDFADIDSSAYYADAVDWAASNGIVNGYGDGTFGPNDDITREQMVAVLYRYAKMKGYNTKASSTLNQFSDKADVSSYAAEAMNWAISKGLVNGMGDGTLAPKANTRRAEVATIFMRFCETILQ